MHWSTLKRIQRNSLSQLQRLWIKEFWKCQSHRVLNRSLQTMRKGQKAIHHEKVIIKSPNKIIKIYPKKRNNKISKNYLSKRKQNKRTKTESRNNPNLKNTIFKQKLKSNLKLIEILCSTLKKFQRSTTVDQW